MGQTSTEEVKKRDLRAELLAAEREAINKKRKAEGKPPLPEEGAQQPAGAITAGEADEEANKRRKLLQEALALDKDDSSDEEDEDGKGKGKDKMDESSDEEDERCVTTYLLPLCRFVSNGVLHSQ